MYTGEFVLHAHLTAQPGEHVLQGGLRYQACDANSCLPPHTIPVSVTLSPGRREFPLRDLQIPRYALPELVGTTSGGRT